MPGQKKLDSSTTRKNEWRSARNRLKEYYPQSNHSNFLDITAMIRSLQRSEGVADCFRKGQIDCDQLDCAWLKYCMEGPRED